MVNGNGATPTPDDRHPQKRPCKHQGENGCDYQYDFVPIPGTKRWRVAGTDYMDHLKAIHPDHEKSKEGNGSGSAAVATRTATNGNGNGNGHGATLIATVPLVDLTHPDLVSRPRITEVFAPAPMGLPANVAHIFPPRLILTALRIEWRMKAIVVVASLGFGWLATFGLKLMSAEVAMVAPLVYFLAAFFLLAVMGPKWTTRPVFVVLKEGEHTKYDWQKWWRRDEGRWPDSWRRDVDKDSDWLRGQRFLMIDAQEWTIENAEELYKLLHQVKEESTVTKRNRIKLEWRRIKGIPVWLVFGQQEIVSTKIKRVPVRKLSDDQQKRADELLSHIYPYIPDKIAAPLIRPEGLDAKIPFADHSMADIGELWTQGHDIRILAGSHTLHKSKVKQMWIMIGIAACLAGIGVFSFLTIQGINGREALRLQVQAQQAAEGQIRAELQRQLQQAGIIGQPQPIVPADLLPNK